MNKGSWTLKIYAMLMPLKKDELFEATIEVLNLKTLEKKVFRTALWMTHGEYIDLGSLCFFPFLKNFQHHYEVNICQMIPFSSFAHKDVYLFKEALDLVQNHTFIAYQLPRENALKKLTIDKSTKY